MKLGLVLLFVLTLQSICSAQVIRTVGIKTGAVAASQSWDYSSPFTDLETDNRWGVDIGLYAEWLDIPVLSLSSEVHYVQKGMKISLPVTTEESPNGTGEYWTRSPRVDYISVPLLVKARFLDGHLLPYVLGGPRVDFLVGTTGEGFELVIDNLEKVDFGATIGVGIEVNSFDSFHLGMEVRFSPSFTDSYSSSNIKVRNSSMEFLLVAGI